MKKTTKNIILIILIYNWALLPELIGQSKEYSVKAALIEKFTHYIEWPKPTGNRIGKETFEVGVVGKSELGDSVKKFFNNLVINGKKVIVSEYDSTTIITRFDILILGNIPGTEISDLQALISKEPILTISDIPEIQNSKVHIVLYVNAEGKVKFKINRKSMDKTGLYVSHLLLKYAEIIE